MIEKFLIGLSPTQRGVLFIAGTLSLLVVFLHFPFDGYKTSDTRRGLGLSGISQECGEIFSLDVMKLDSRQLDTRLMCEKERNEAINGREVERQFLDWQSRAAVVEWFGSILNAGISLIFLIAVGVFGFFIFSPSGGEKK